MISRLAFYFAVLAFAAIVRGQPLAKSGGSIKCAADSFSGTLKYHRSAFHGSKYNVSVHESHGLQEIAIQDGEPIQVIGRLCSSTYLNWSYTEDDDATAFQPTKIFLAGDESKCVVRHAILHSDTASTHITIEPCSDVDDAGQEKQFWSGDRNGNTVVPIISKNGEQKRMFLLDEKKNNTTLLVSDLHSYNNNALRIVQ